MKTVTLREITLNITDGKHGDCEPAENSGYYFVSCKDVNNGTVDYANARQISERAFLETHKRTQLEPNDILITNSGTIGRMALVKDIPETYRTTFQKSVAIVKPDTSVVLPTYLYYKLQNCVTDFVNRSNGSAQKNLLLGTMREFQIDLHEDFAEQERLSSILAAYDNLIENNQKQIKLLEEAAQRLYKEWFVDLRFPGHEDIEIVDGVPEGWTVKSMEEIADYLNGYAFKPSDWGEIGKPIIKIKELNDGITKDTPRNTGVDIPEKYRVLPGDIVFSWSATLTAKIWDAEEGLLNQHLFKVTPYDGFCREYVLQSILQTLDEFRNLTTGSTMKHIQRGKLKQVFVKVPSPKIMDEYKKYADIIRRQILVLGHKIILLQEARDRLLPKLMNGEMEI